MDRDVDRERDEEPTEERRTPWDRREQNRRTDPRYTPGGSQVPDRRSGARRRGDDTVG